MLTHANIQRPRCTPIVVHVAVSTTTGNSVYTSRLQRTTSRVTTLDHQTSSVDPISEDKLIYSCIQKLLKKYKKWVIWYKNEDFIRTWGRGGGCGNGGGRCSGGNSEVG